MSRTGARGPLRRKPFVTYARMGVAKFRVAVVVWALVATLVSAQITFSRDWTGGKRAPAPLDAQLTRLCRQFVDELKASLGAPAFGNHRPASDDPLAYDDDN
ncbi:uncharacterized protein isoform X2 [Choristoneura fumiferana]|uniref:uncharacterized protein isoform X2 n=1 Tax=Choristoneura fumiferana TaxID=7141 RepID=UPI003D154696